MAAGHDIGGGVAQHLMLANKVEVPRVAVVNGIMYDSWPVPGVARFRDPAVAAPTTRDDVLAARRVLRREGARASRERSRNHRIS